VQELLRAAQGVLKLEDKYGQERLEPKVSVAKRPVHGPIHFNSISYKSIKDILKKELEDDYVADLTSQPIEQVYQGFGIYQRADAIDLNLVQASGHA